MDELTYLLGAGASFQSFPLVKSFPSRFDIFVKEVENLEKDDFIINNGLRSKVQEFYGIAKPLAEEFRSHQSFDTYFKKLFHINQIVGIRTTKKILNLYFIWEHLANVDQDTKSKSFDVFFKEAKVDKRYDALIAGLLQPIPGESKLYCKTNFITWNYDMNLLISIKNYFYPQNTFSEYLDMIGFNKNKMELDVNGQISIISMNGFFYSYYFDNEYSLRGLDFRRVVQKKLSEDYFNDTFDDSDAALIKFAWESSNDGTLASEKITRSKNLVIIGYTFPLYNRLVDSNYIDNDVANGRDVYIQDPCANDIEETFRNSFDVLRAFEITKIENCDSFFVPSNIFQSSYI